MRVAILHDWIFNLGIQERVLEALCEIYTDADVLVFGKNNTSLPANIVSHNIKNANLVKQGVALWKFIDRFPRELLKFDLSNYDLVISNSLGPMRWIQKSTGMKHISFFYQAYPFLHVDWQKMNQKRTLANLFSRFNKETQLKFRQQDKEYASEIDLVFTHSKRMANILRDLYGIEAESLHFPVNYQYFYPRKADIEDYFLLCDTIEPGRGIEAIIQSFEYLKDHLVILGGGSAIESMKSRNRSNISFITKDHEANRAKLMSKARAVICCSTYHYNHAGLEALAMGRPVICHRRSTLAEEIKHGQNGLIYDENTPDSILPCIFEFDNLNMHQKALRPADGFSKQSFKDNVKKQLDTLQATKA